jgi:hypothetical protein
MREGFVNCSKFADSFPFCAGVSEEAVLVVCWSGNVTIASTILSQASLAQTLRLAKCYCDELRRESLEVWKSRPYASLVERSKETSAGCVEIPREVWRRRLVPVIFFSNLVHVVLGGVVVDAFEPLSSPIDGRTV